MTFPVWPSGLPCPTANSAASAPQSNLRAFKPDMGPPISRRASTARWRRLSFALHLTRDELDLLETFLDRDCAGGASPFWMTDPITRDLRAWKLVSGEADLFSIAQVSPNGFTVSLSLISVPE